MLFGSRRAKGSSIVYRYDINIIVVSVSVESRQHAKNMSTVEKVNNQTNTMTINTGTRFTIHYFGAAWAMMVGTWAVVAASYSDYHPYQYDLTIPQYTPDGRLLQVEYAQKASMEHSIPIVVATLYDSHHRDDATTKTDAEQITILIAGHRTRTGQQSRLMVVPSQITTMSSRCRGHDPSITGNDNSMMVFAISGIISDALAILQMIQSFRIREYRTIGSSCGGGSSSTMIRRIAYQMASTCQSRTITGGNRPYGATLWIMSTHNVHCRQLPAPILLHQIDPSGAIYDIVLQPSLLPPLDSSAHNDSDHHARSKPAVDSAAVAVLGGGVIRAKIQRRLQTDWMVMDQRPLDNNNNNNNTSIKAIRHRIGHLLSMVLDEYQSNFLLSKHDEDDVGATTTTTTTTTTSPGVYDFLEVVLISSKRGTTKLSSHQIAYLIQQYSAAKKELESAK